MLMVREKMLVCDVADAIEKMPESVRYVSLKFARDPAVDIGSPKDVLEQVCRNVFAHRNMSARLRGVVRWLNPGWLNVNTTRMKRPCEVFNGYFVDLAGDDKAHFSRAARVLEWCECSGSYARITYAVPDKGDETGGGIKNGLDGKRSSVDGIGEYDSQWEEKYRIICERFPCIVTFEEYINFFVDEFGLTRSTAINHIHSFFIRLDGERAIPVDVFAKKSSWSEEDDKKLESAVRDWLGGAPFLPLASIPKSFFDRLPKVSFDGIQLKWTHELLEGIVWHLSSIPCTNYYAAWSLVSTYVVPEDVLDQDGCPPPEVDYVLGIYCDRNPEHYSVEDAFNFLKENAVRIRLGRSLHKQIEGFLTRRANRHGGSISGMDGGNGSQTLPVRVSDVSGAIVPMPSLSQVIELDGWFEQDLRENYCNGFDFKETSRRLVGERVGKKFGDEVADRLKGQMFQCANGLWLFSDMVTSDEALERMKGRAKEFLSENGCFAMDALQSEFEGEMRNIADGRDFDAFFAKFVAEDVRGIVRGHGDWRVCFEENVPEDAGWDAIAERIRDVLKDCGDAVLVEDIIAQMPCLVRGVVKHLAKERMEDVVVFEVGGVEYVKLLESYYLPDDFSATITGFVETTEAAQGVVSVVLLEAELDGHYGDGFRVSYGLEDDSVFKQVVSKSFTGEDHGWNRDMFTRYGRRGESNVAEVFVKGHSDIFHEEDFFRYALESRGMKNRGMLILTFLRKHCIRLSKERWMSIDSFEAKFGMSETQYHQIGQILNEIVGNSRFMPISSIGEDVYDRFPRLESEGKEYPWNPYLLTSVAVHKVRNARVINDDPSPYTVTAMILPYAVDKIDDVVEYVLGAFPVGYFTDVDSAFGYLKANNVRLTKTEKLAAKIKNVLGIP